MGSNFALNKKINMNKFLVVAFIIISSPLFSQSNKKQQDDPKKLNLKEIIIKGNRLETPFSQATRDIQVISSREIEALPVKSLNELLSYFGGVDIRQRGPFGTQTDISIDGGTFEQTLILINGVKMIDAQTAHNMMNLPLPLNTIDHIEILRGPAARIYGINALTGAINIVTKKESKSSITLDLQSGSSFKQKEEGDGEGIYGGGSIDLAAIYGTDKQSHLLALSQSNYNGQRYNSAANNSRAFYNGEVIFNHQNSVQIMAGTALSRFGANGFYAAPGDINSEEIVNSSIISISSNHGRDNFSLTPRISNRFGKDDYRYFKDNLDVGRSLHHSNNLMLELNSNLKTHFGVLGFGIESRMEKINSSNIGLHQRNNHGAYAEIKSGIGSRLSGTAGLYSNYNTDFGWQFYPGIDVSYIINSHWRISGNIGSGQRIPSFTDLYLNQLPGNVGNPDILPESAISYEANIAYSKNGLQLKTGYFYRNISEFIDWVRKDDSVPYTTINLDGNQIHGFYGRLQQDFDLNNQNIIGYKFSYNYLNPSAYATLNVQSKYVLESLRHQVIASILYRQDDFSLQIQNRLLKRELGDFYNLLDLQASYKINAFKVSAEITNILNAQYIESGAVPMPGRWLSIGLTYNWEK